MPVDSSGRLIRARAPVAPVRPATPTPTAPPLPPMRFPDMERQLHHGTIAGSAEAADARRDEAQAQRIRAGIPPATSDLQALADTLGKR